LAQPQTPPLKKSGSAIQQDKLRREGKGQKNVGEY